MAVRSLPLALLGAGVAGVFVVVAAGIALNPTSPTGDVVKPAGAIIVGTCAIGAFVLAAVGTSVVVVTKGTVDVVMVLLIVVAGMIVVDGTTVGFKDGDTVGFP